MEVHSSAVMCTHPCPAWPTHPQPWCCPKSQKAWMTAPSRTTHGGKASSESVLIVRMLWAVHYLPHCHQGWLFVVFTLHQPPCSPGQQCPAAQAPKPPLALSPVTSCASAWPQLTPFSHCSSFLFNSRSCGQKLVLQQLKKEAWGIASSHGNLPCLCNGICKHLVYLCVGLASVQHCCKADVSK